MLRGPPKRPWTRPGSALPDVDQPALLADPPLAVERRPVLVADQLEGGGTPTLGDDHAPSEEDLPQPEPPLAVTRDDLFPVAEPVPVPAFDGHRVVDPDVLHAVDLEARALEVVAHEAERHRGVRAREHVLRHEEAPGEVLGRPVPPQARDLEEEDTVVLEHRVELPHERLELPDPDVLGHLQ